MPDIMIPAGSVEPASPQSLSPMPDGSGPDRGKNRRVVWKFGGTSVGDGARLRAVAARLVAARREGLQVVAVLSAMAGSTNDLLRLALDLSPAPRPRELDALLSVGESMSCALAAIAVHELGERAVSLTGWQAGVHTDGAHGNAGVRRVTPERVVEALRENAIVLVTGFQGVSANGDITTLGRGGSDASAIALASAMGLSECDIFTDVPGVLTADPRVVPTARKLEWVSHDEMLQLSDAGAGVLQTRAVELAAAHGIDIHVRSSFTFEPGTWVRRDTPRPEETRVCGVAHIVHDPLYTVTGVSPAVVSAALAQRDVAIGSMVGDDGAVWFTAPGTAPGQLIAALAAVDAAVAVRDDVGSVSVVGATAATRSEIIATALSALERIDVGVQLVTRTPNRVSCHVLSSHVEFAARALHAAFWLHEPAMAAGGVATTMATAMHV